MFPHSGITALSVGAVHITLSQGSWSSNELRPAEHMTLSPSTRTDKINFALSGRPVLPDAHHMPWYRPWRSSGLAAATERMSAKSRRVPRMCIVPIVVRRSDTRCVSTVIGLIEAGALFG